MILPIVVLAGLPFAQIKEPKPGMNLFSKEQDIQLGKEAAGEIEKQYEVIRDLELQHYIDNIGQKLTRSKRASEQPGGFSWSSAYLHPSATALAKQLLSLRREHGSTSAA